MAILESPLLLLFDLDDTLVLTNAIKGLRDSRRWPAVYKSFSNTTVPPETLDFIEKWRRNAHLGVVTNSPRQYAERLLDYHGLSIPVLSAYRDTSQHKPHPAPIINALKKVGVTPPDCIYIGDLAEDVMAGRSASVKTILISWNDCGSRSLPDVPFCRSWHEVSTTIEQIIAQRHRGKAT